jgi:hypothetical protein
MDSRGPHMDKSLPRKRKRELTMGPTWTHVAPFSFVIIEGR